MHLPLSGSGPESTARSGIRWERPSAHPRPRVPRGLAQERGTTMKHTLLMVLMATSLVSPIDASAQRSRNRTQAERPPAPFRASGRIVYSSQRAFPTPRNARRSARTIWGGLHLNVRGRANGRSLNQGQLRNVLGRRTVDRVRRAGRQSGLRGSVHGRWQRHRGRGLTLVVTMDRVVVAEFVDRNRDGYVDDGFLIGETRGRRAGNRYRATNRW